MLLPFRFEPALQLNLELPVRVEISIDLNLLHRFHPSIEPVSVRGNIKDVMTPQNPLKPLKPAVLTIAKLVSNGIFGSTDAVREDCMPIGHWERDGTLRAIFFYLHHRLRWEDVGLNPEYVRLVGDDVDGELVLRPWVLTGERRRERNEDYEGPASRFSGPEIALL